MRMAYLGGDPRKHHREVRLQSAGSHPGQLGYHPGQLGGSWGPAQLGNSRRLLPHLSGRDLGYLPSHSTVSGWQGLFQKDRREHELLSISNRPRHSPAWLPQAEKALQQSCGWGQARGYGPAMFSIHYKGRDDFRENLSLFLIKGI